MKCRGGIDPFCFLRVPDFADKMLPATARHNIEETQIVSCHIFCFNSFVNVASWLQKRLRQRYPAVVPSGTYLVLRTHPDDAAHPSAISVLILEPIIWRDSPNLCLVSHRGLSAHYTTTSTFLNTKCALLPLRVPVALLVLEHDWIIVRQSHFGTLYGCPRLQSGSQVAFAHVWDHATAHSHRHAPDCIDDASVLMVGDFWCCTSDSNDVGDLWILVLGFIAKSQSNWEVLRLLKHMIFTFSALCLRRTLPHFTTWTWTFQFPHTTASGSAYGL